MRWIWQPDKWERLSTVVLLAGDTRSILDVGGRGAEMRRLSPAPTVLSVNIEPPCDLLVRPGRLPFDDAAFETCVSCDVLEHLPPDDRPAHVVDLIRVAASRVVICFPCGSDGKDRSERRLADQLARDFDVRFDFLEEHLANGLPRVSDVASMVQEAAPDARVTMLFQDGVLEAERLLRDAVMALKGHHFPAFLRSVRAWLVRRPPDLTEARSPDNNRVYIVIDQAER